MMRPTLEFALVGAAVAALTLPLLVGPLWILCLSGPLFVLAIRIAVWLSGSVHELGARQYVLMAVLYPAANALAIPLSWRALDPHFNTTETQIALQPTLGIVLADVLILLGLRGILKTRPGVRDRHGIGLATACLVVAQAGCFLLELFGRFYRFFHYQPLTSSLMASFAVLCGYIGHRLAMGEPRAEASAAGVRSEGS